MIELTRFNGNTFTLNPDMILTVEATPDTIVNLTDGERYMVKESVSAVTEKIIAFRAAIYATATFYVQQHEQQVQQTQIGAIPNAPTLRVITGQEY